MRDSSLNGAHQENYQVIIGIKAVSCDIDRNNGPIVIHAGVSRNLVDYCQKDGLSGQDGMLSKCVTLYHLNYSTRLREYTPEDNCLSPWNRYLRDFDE